MIKTEYFNVSERISNVYGLMATEFFIPFNNGEIERFANRNRASIGFGQLLPKGHRYEVNFIWQQSKGKTTDSKNTDQWILRLRYFLNRNFYT